MFNFAVFLFSDFLSYSSGPEQIIKRLITCFRTDTTVFCSHLVVDKENYIKRHKVMAGITSRALIIAVTSSRLTRSFSGI